MYKVMIVDDEPLLRFAVRNLLKWEDYGFAVEGEAGNGLEALKMARELHPDLIFADIRMPQMDGLEMVEVLQKECSASVVILSNYDDFAYAQAALRLGVDDYVLKASLNAESLKKILEKQRRKFEALKEQNLLIGNAEKKTGSLTAILKEMILRKGVTENMEEMDRKLLSPLRVPYCVVSVTDFQADYLHRIFTSEDSSRISMFNNLLENIVGDRLHGKGHYFLAKDTECVIVLSEPDFHELGGERFWKSIAGLLERYTNRAYLVGISRCGQGVQQFYTLYQESVFAADRYFFDETNRVFSFEKVDAPPSDNLRGLLGRFFDQAGEVSFAFSMPATILEMLEETKKAQLLSSKCKTILSNAILLYNVKLSGEQEDHLAALSDRFAEKIHFAGTYTEMKREIQNLLDTMGSSMNEMGKYSLPVQQTIQWIEENYRERITLVMAAKQIAIHPNHLSRIFSQQTGKSFSVYLNDYRMEKAKSLLLNRALSVQDIGERVGIPNAKYFGDVFKKWCGMSPTEYRQMIQQKKS